MKTRGFVPKRTHALQLKTNRISAPIFGFKPVLTPKQIVAKMTYAQLKNRFTLHAHLPEVELRRIAEKELGGEEK